MVVYIIRRIFYSFLLMIFASTLIFFIVNSMPGNPYDRMRREMAETDPAKLARIPESHWARLNALLGLDKPVQVRYILWIRSILTGSFGSSWSLMTGTDVMAAIWTRLPYTLLLILATAGMALVISVPSGIYAAVHQYTDADLLITMGSFLGIAMPSFWFGLLLISIFSRGLNWLPPTGVASREMPGDIIMVIERVLSLGKAFPEIAGMEKYIFVDGLKHLVMPTITLSILLTARWSRYVRTSLLEVLNQDYIRTARAKGASTRTVIRKHAMRNAWIPILTVLALDIPMLLTNAFITEIVFSWPGIGRLYVDSVRNADWPLLISLLIVYMFFLLSSNLFADILYSFVDPRIRYTTARVR